MWSASSLAAISLWGNQVGKNITRVQVAIDRFGAGLKKDRKFTEHQVVKKDCKLQTDFEVWIADWVLKHNRPILRLPK